MKTCDTRQTKGHRRREMRTQSVRESVRVGANADSLLLTTLLLEGKECRGLLPQSPSQWPIIIVAHGEKKKSALSSGVVQINLVICDDRRNPSVDVRASVVGLWRSGRMAVKALGPTDGSDISGAAKSNRLCSTGARGPGHPSHLGSP